MAGNKQDFTYRKLGALIFSGYFAPGSKLPNEPELAKLLGVARITLRAALTRLESEGLVTRSRSAGTVVRHEKSSVPKVLLISQMTPASAIEVPMLYLNPGVERRCRELGWQLEYLPPEFVSETFPAGRDVFGILTTGHNFSGKEPWLKKLQRCGLPAVCVHGFHQDPKVTGFATVMTDIRHAWEEGVLHLVRRGHRRIAVLLRNEELVFQRMNLTSDAIFEILRKSGASDDPALIFHPDQCGFDAVAETVSAMPDPPTAVYCYSDFFAVQLYAALKERKIKIPNDISVLGFCGFPGGSMMRPSLSTVDFNYERLGAMAVDLLACHAQWEHDPVKPIVFAPYDIVSRESTNHYLINWKGEHR